MISGIYKITCKANGRIYVGSAVKLSNRWRQHRDALIRGDHDNARLQNSWNKYGADAFEWEVIEHVEPKLLIEREKHFMALLNAFDSELGFNLTPVAGSMLGFKHNEESLDKMAAAKIGRKQTPEHIESRIRHRRGKKRNPETAAKIADAQRGVPRKPLTEEHKEKVSLAMHGKAPKNLSSLWSPEVVAKRESTKKRRKAERAALSGQQRELAFTEEK